MKPSRGVESGELVLGSRRAAAPLRMTAPALSVLRQMRTRVAHPPIFHGENGFAARLLADARAFCDTTVNDRIVLLGRLTLPG